MQIIDLPENVKTALLKHLTEPFQTLSDAKAYWLENGTQLVISAVPKNPEYTDPLPDGYTISLVITSEMARESTI